LRSSSLAIGPGRSYPMVSANPRRLLRYLSPIFPVIVQRTGRVDTDLRHQNVSFPRVHSSCIHARCARMRSLAARNSPEFAWGVAPLQGAFRLQKASTVAGEFHTATLCRRLENMTILTLRKREGVRLATNLGGHFKHGMDPRSPLGRVDRNSSDAVLRFGDNSATQQLRMSSPDPRTARRSRTQADPAGNQATVGSPRTTEERVRLEPGETAESSSGPSDSAGRREAVTRPPRRDRLPGTRLRSCAPGDAHRRSSHRCLRPDETHEDRRRLPQGAGGRRPSRDHRALGASPIPVGDAPS
jgi:hypothetical protein